MNNNIQTRHFLFVLGCTGLWGATVFAATPARQIPPGAPAVAGLAPVSNPSANTEPAYLSYTYYGDRYRDPFIPLNGESRSSTSLDRPPAIASLSLKGIVQDSRGRMALLTGGVDSYILRDGRLYDGRNKMVKGISGIIKIDSVVIIGSDRTVKELRAKPAL